LVVLSVPGIVSAQALWGEVSLPGGVAAARDVLRLGGSAGRLDALWVTDFIRRYAFDHFDEAVATLDAGAALADAIRRDGAAWPNGVSLPDATAPEAEVRRVRGFLEDLGLTLTRTPTGYHVSPAARDDGDVRADWRAAWLDRGGLAADLNAGRPVSATLTDTALPLPLPAYWAPAIFRGGDPSLAAILRDRRLAFLYVGLSSLNDETLRYMGQQPGLLNSIRDRDAAAFAAFGRSLEVTGDGAVRVPGGAGAEGVWEALAGVSPAHASEFVTRLFDRDDGRLAYFYDTVAHLSPERQAFALGAAGDGGARLDAASRVYHMFVSANPEWKASERALFRARFDPAVALLLVDVDPEGAAGPAWWPALFDRVWSARDWPSAAGGQLPSSQADAAWLLERVFAAGGDPPARFAMVRFLQRTFAAAPIASAFDLELVLRCRQDMPALALVLERMGVRDPSLFARLALAAHRMSEGGDRDEVTRRVGGWQAALGVVDQIQRRAHWSPDRLNPLLVSLADAGEASVKGTPGVVASWVVEHLLPAVSDARSAADDPETAVVAALAGADAGPAPRLSWEGLDYVVDTAGATVRDATAILDAGAAPRLDVLVRLQTAYRALDERTSPEDVRALAAILKALPASIDGAASVAKALDAVDASGDAQRISRQRQAIGRILDDLTEAALDAIVCAAAAAPNAQPPAMFAQLWQTHTLAPDASGGGSWQGALWRPARIAPRRAGGTELRGSLLGVDGALGDAQLPPAPLLAVGGMPQVAEETHNLLVRSFAFREPFASWGPADAQTVLAGLRAGRELATAWDRESPTRDSLEAALRGAGVDEWRRNALLWMRERQPGLLALALTPTEVYVLGSGGPLPQAWRASLSPPDDCFCVSHPPAGSIENARGRGALPASLLMSNVAIYLTEALDALHLPAGLIPLMMPRTVQVWLAHVQQYGPDDWYALAAWPRRPASGAIDDVLLTLVGQGILASPPRPAAVQGGSR
jgi:hypothetical protein